MVPPVFPSTNALWRLMCLKENTIIPYGNTLDFGSASGREALDKLQSMRPCPNLIG
jgi:hypothetical protein